MTLSAPAELYVVATPIGNLGDLSSRAVDVLRTADVIVAEDTRRARALLAHLGADGREVLRADEHATEAAIEGIVDRLRRGQSVALTTDAGTPVVSDPGAALVRRAREAGIRVVPIPGPSAAMAALSVAGFHAEQFWFVGFLPRGGTERVAALRALFNFSHAIILFESPYRMTETLRDLAQQMPTREVCVAREITKLHEEHLWGSAKDLSEQHGAREWKGEVTLVLGPFVPEAAPPMAEAELRGVVDEELERGGGAKQMAERVSLRTGLSTREAYALVISRKRGAPG